MGIVETLLIYALVGLVVASACGPGAGVARGHFLFIRIGPNAEAGRSAEVYFSEQAEAGELAFERFWGRCGFRGGHIAAKWRLLT